MSATHGLQAGAVAVCLLARALPAPAVPPDIVAGFRLSDRLADVRVEDGEVVLQTPGGPRRVDAETFVRALEARQRDGQSRGPLFRLFDITGPLGLIWVAVGLGGQLIFLGRMLVQWLASERARRSVVPVAFWWMSLLGSSMLLSYFTWRGDLVGILGQALGWVVYARNLWLIRRAPGPALPSPIG